MAAKNRTLEWLGLEAPRYTSYPSAHHFLPQPDETAYAGWLDAMKQDASLSVYVHIPYCRQLCWFCGCHTKMTRRYEPVARYVQVLLKEIELLKRHTKGRGQLVNIHFGGGSPSLLAPGDLLSILYGLASTFESHPTGELAIELDPRTATPENIALYADMGFTRISIGVQDFNEEVQQAINRVQPFAMVSSVVDRIRASGIEAINCDLIYGLPLQTPERFRVTLEKTIALDPSRIALFSYAHMPQLKKHQRMIDAAQLPGEMDKLALYEMACMVLAEHGYHAIGIDHFAKADDPLAIAQRNHTLKRNFQGYVTDATEILIGIGSSAISQLPQGYAQNSTQAQDYRDRVESGRLPVVRGFDFSGEDHLRKTIIDELMCFMQVDLAAIAERYGVAPSHFKPELAELVPLVQMGIADVSGYEIKVASPYRMAARVVASVFDQYRAVAAGRYSKVA